MSNGFQASAARNSYEINLKSFSSEQRRCTMGYSVCTICCNLVRFSVWQWCTFLPGCYIMSVLRAAIWALVSWLVFCSMCKCVCKCTSMCMCECVWAETGKQVGRERAALFPDSRSWSSSGLWLYRSVTPDIEALPKTRTGRKRTFALINLSSLTENKCFCHSDSPFTTTESGRKGINRIHPSPASS